MSMTRPSIFTFLIIILFIGISGCSDQAARIGDQAPEFTLTDVNDKSHTLSAYRGQELTVVHFWTDFCDACRKEFPKIESYYRDLHPEGLEILAVNVGQSKNVSEAFQKEFGVTFPMLIDEDQILSEPYGIEVYPTNFLIDRNGKIVREIRGWADRTTVEGILHSIKVNQ
jgi:peroxiredoxin